MFLLDISRSTAGQAIRDSYESAFVLAADPEFGDIFALDVIDANPQAHGALRQANLQCSGSASFLDCEESRALALERLREEFRDRLQTVESGTDILGGLRNASAYFASTAQECKRLIIFSDMLIRRQGIVFSQEEFWEEVTTETLLERLGPPPALDGVDVFLVGVGVERSGNLQVGQPLRAFWEGFFSLAGAEVKSWLAGLPPDYPPPCEE